MAKREKIEVNEDNTRYARRDEIGHLTSQSSTLAEENKNYSNESKGDEPELSADEKLMYLRQKIVESGRPLLSWDEINEEVARRRGGIK